MRTTVLNMNRRIMLDKMPETVLSFRPFIDYLKQRREEPGCQKDRFFSFVIEQFESEPGLMGPVDVEKVKAYERQLQLIYSTVSPIIEDENTHRWAICIPLQPVVFYGTNAYYDLVADQETGDVRAGIVNKNPEDIRRHQLEFTYSMLLKKLYNFHSFFNRDIIHSIIDESTGLTRYFRLNLDIRFVNITTIKPIPELKLEDLHLGSYDTDETLAMLQEKLPLDSFRFEGFSIITATDVTAQQAIENIKNFIIAESSIDEEDYYQNLTSSLKTLVGHTDVEFGLIPVLQVNNRLIFNDTECTHSKLISTAVASGTGEATYKELAENYFKNPKQVIYRDILDADETKQPYLKVLRTKGIRAYGLLPVYFNNNLAGVLEIFSNKAGMLDEMLLSKLEPVMPHLAQLLKRNIDQFNNSIDHIVKEKFTAVQPSVQWKFNEAAWHYIRNNHGNDSQREIEEIIFEKVYPLYGAIDIRNSTVERNAAMRADLTVQFNSLMETLNTLKEKTGFGLLDEKIFLTRKWRDRINSANGFNQEVRLNDFLDNNVLPFLQEFAEGNTEAAPIVNKYMEAIDPVRGVATENRRMLETSMNTLISSVNKYMDMMKTEVQHAYPSYFEKFRTDGVEYDIYIGQSIAPEKPFSDIYLKNLRLLQLTSMAAIARYTNALLPQLPKPVETTQLIFIHSQPIDIRFRKDEKRFDVEGTYNIRYHIVKKRIDKVLLKGKRERLTQPGKIALVYFSQKEADEYIGYIRYLQDQHILLDDLEELDLEELQGVSGLKALRVGVAID